MIEESIGVGPHPQPWPVGDQYDPELLKVGDQRNVLDKYRYWKVESIKADLDTSRVELEIAIENWQRDFNMGTIIRTANAFNISKVHIIGRRQWNKRGAMVTDVYMNIEYHPDTASFLEVMRKTGREVFGVDIVDDSKNISDITLPHNAVLVFGAEGPGLSDDLLAAAKQVVMIEQSGSTRSINVGVAAGIAMYMWLQQQPLTH